jgi:RimJ/RimL family protein N-acetyltransferase
LIIPPLAPTIDWAELRLRGLRREDAPSWFAYLADPIVIQHTSFPVQSLASVEALIEQSQRGYSERSSCKWALARTSDDALIGTCGFNAWAPEHASTELAYDLARQHWGKGLMSQAVAVALNWGFNTVGFNRIHALVMISNVRSARLLERFGFRREGALRSYRVARGVPRDFSMYSLLQAEWAAASKGGIPATGADGGRGLVDA